MSSLVKISEAASLALHAMVFLKAKEDAVVPTKEIATALHASEAHLSKVLQRLSRSGLVRPVRGPKGGFTLTRPADEFTLLDVFESIEGPIVSDTCLLSHPFCRGERCILGPFLKEVNEHAHQYFARTKLSELTEIVANPAGHRDVESAVS